jgi:hypothetical protein
MSDSELAFVLQERVKELEAEVRELKELAFYDAQLIGIIRLNKKLLEAEVSRLTDELINLEEVAKDRYCKMQTEIERLRGEINE